ncbi:MAG TPA: rod shape-determining protein MreC [Vicinamibacterales bacterium]|jgi:rod shape-determining protein MreC|nr:rod shape-determining protein MreC [Vicinamibacterales bacterium]
MALLDIRQRTGWLFGAIVVSHIILISAQVTTKRGVPILQEVTFGAFAEMQRAATTAFGSAREGWQNYFALQQIRRENEQLKAEVTKLRVSLEQERSTAQQTRTLQQLLDLRSATSFETVAAAVIGSGADPEFRTITIDKGTQDGLRADMAVMSPAGIVGRILMPTARAAKVQLIIDRDAAAGVMVERTRVAGIVTGVGNAEELGFRAGLIDLNYVPSSADVKRGDRVVTSGIDGIYPKGLPVGEIQSAEREGGERRIRVKPSVDFAALEAVLVVLKAPEPPSETTDDGER